MKLLVDTLAVARLTRLVTRDRITRRPRNWVWEHAPEPIAALVDCPWCVSIWAAAGVVAARRFAPRAWSPVAAALAMSEVAGIVAGARVPPASGGSVPRP